MHGVASDRITTVSVFTIEQTRSVMPSYHFGNHSNLERGPHMLPRRRELWGKSILSELNIPKMPLSNIASERVRPIEVPLVEPRPGAQFSYRILVVDDESSIRETSKPLLESLGYEVVTAYDGLDGLHALSKSLPDVIISDLHMPRMSGFEFLAIVRKRFPHIAIIAMSGEFIPGENLHVVMADAFWQKGQPIKNLFQEIARVVAASPARSEREKNDIEPLLVQRSSAGCLMITCPKCLRPSKLEATTLNGGIHETICPSCSTSVKFEINQEIERTT
jgi:CheY-like chemotaxis protein